MSYADEIRALLAKKEAMQASQPKSDYPTRMGGYYDWFLATQDYEAKKRQSAEIPRSAGISHPAGTTIHPIVQVVPQTVPPQKKAGWGWAFLIVGGGLFIFWGIPLIQGKGKLNPGMSKTPGYAPTRNSPGTAEE